MTQEDWRTWTLLFMAVGQNLFAACYFVYGWWSTPLGRILFTKAVCFAALLDIAVASRFFDWGNEDEMFTVTYTLLSVAIWVQLVAFLHIRTLVRGDET